MTDFQAGDRVVFLAPNREMKSGVVVEVRKKTVAIRTNEDNPFARTTMRYNVPIWVVRRTF